MGMGIGFKLKSVRGWMGTGRERSAINPTRSFSRRKSEGGGAAMLLLVYDRDNVRRHRMKISARRSGGMVVFVLRLAGENIFCMCHATRYAKSIGYPFKKKHVDNWKENCCYS